jgi:hypothetical protein
MGIIVKLVDQQSITINGDSIAYAEGGNVLEILNEAEEMLAAFRNWEYAIVQESEEEYQRSVAELDDEEDEDLEEDDDEELDDEDLDEEDEEETPPNGAVSDLGELIAVDHADILARLAQDGAPTN